MGLGGGGGGLGFRGQGWGNPPTFHFGWVAKFLRRDSRLVNINPNHFWLIINPKNLQKVLLSIIQI